jgi:hypothetical protein
VGRRKEEGMRQGKAGNGRNEIKGMYGYMRWTKRREEVEKKEKGGGLGGGKSEGGRRLGEREKTKRRWRGRMEDKRRRKAERKKVGERESKMIWKFRRKVEDGGTHKLMIGGRVGGGRGV